jgi:hypothetical protein
VERSRTVEPNNLDSSTSKIPDAELAVEFRIPLPHEGVRCQYDND